MSEFLTQLDQTANLLKHPLVTKELAKAYDRSIEWVRRNADALEKAGWSAEMFYELGRLAFPYSNWGPGWMPLWNSDKCELTLSAKGNLEFILHEAGGDVIQTCYLQRNFLAQ